MVDIRCQYEPTESGHCGTCGAAYPLTCPLSGGVLSDPSRGGFVSLGDALKPVLERLKRGAALVGGLIEGTVDDDRA